MSVPVLEIESYVKSHAGHLGAHGIEHTSSDPSPSKILFVDHTAALGGGELALLDLVTHLDPDRCRPIVLLFSDGLLVKRLRDAGIETYILPLADSVVHTRKDSLGRGSLLRIKDIGRTAAHILRVARFMREHAVDVVHTNSLKADIIGGVAARLARKPLIWHIRDRIVDDYLPRPVVKIFRTLCLALPDYVVANSSATLATVSHPRMKRAGVLYSGIEIEDMPAPFLEKQPRGPRIGMVGRISPWKGQHIFLRAAAQVRKVYPEAEFQVIGAPLFSEQAYEAEMRGLCDSLGITEWVEFTGFSDDVNATITDLDMLVHASVKAEPFGRVVVEGMAAGKPIVATNGGGIPEIVEDGVTGLLVPMADPDAMARAIIRLLDDPSLAREMGLRGRRRALDHFSVHAAARKAERIYDELLGPAIVRAPQTTGSPEPVPVD